MNNKQMKMTIKIPILLLNIVGGLLVLSCTTQPKVNADYSVYVNPFIGNADNGHTFPDAAFLSV